MLRDLNYSVDNLFIHLAHGAALQAKMVERGSDWFCYKNVLFLFIQYDEKHKSYLILNQKTINKIHPGLIQETAFNDVDDLLLMIYHFKSKKIWFYCDGNLGFPGSDAPSPLVFEWMNQIKPHCITLFSGTEACLAWFRCWAIDAGLMMDDHEIFEENIQNAVQNQELKLIHESTKKPLVYVINMIDVLKYVQSHLNQKQPLVTIHEITEKITMTQPFPKMIGSDLKPEKPLEKSRRGGFTFFYCCMNTSAVVVPKLVPPPHYFDSKFRCIES